MEKKQTRILPNKWDVLNLPSSSTKYLFGFHYSQTSYSYTVYITDLSKVWMGDADEEKIKLKALQHGISEGTLSRVYYTIIETFKNNFNGDDTETHIDLEKNMVDDSHPLELKLKLAKVYSHDTLYWSFDLVRLPEASSISISIFRNVIFHLSTIVFSLNEYRKDLSHRIEQKDSAIRFLSETLEDMNSTDKIKRWAPERSSNNEILKSFDPVEFDKSWRESKLAGLQGKNIWDILKSNSDNNTWSMGTSFTEGSTRESSVHSNDETVNLVSRKRHLDGNSEGNESYKATMTQEQGKRNDSVPKKRKTENIADLAEDLKEYDLKREFFSKAAEEENEIPKRMKTESPTPNPNLDPNDQLNSSPPQQSQKTPEHKRKRDFGQSRKRRINQSRFSPIKSAKYFQSDD